MPAFFKLRFEYPIEDTSIVIPLQAVAECSADADCFHVHSFELRVRNSDGQERKSAILPAISIYSQREEGIIMWVHCDSQKESYLSRYAGMAIDLAVQEQSQQET